MLGMSDSQVLHEYKVYQHLYRKCVECHRVFDMTDEIDAQEWNYGHDCEV